MGKIVGIDLGTTNSVVAVLMGGEPVVIPTAEGETSARRSLHLPRRVSGWWGKRLAGRRSSIRRTPSSPLSG